MLISGPFPFFRRFTWQLATHCAVFIIGIVSFGILLRADWYIIDDHEIVALIGPKHSLSIAEAIGAFWNSEINPAASLPRFRPVYYALRLSEAVVFGQTVALWYGLRIVIFLVFGLALSRMTLRFFRPEIAFFLIVYLLVQGYWGAIIGFLGPSETYVVLGLALVIFAFLRPSIWLPKTSALTLLALGIVVCAGSKENFVLLAAIPLVLGFQLRNRVSFAHCVILALPVLFCLWIALTVSHRVHLAHHDIYMNDASVLGRLSLVSSFISKPLVLVWAILIVSFCALMRFTAAGRRILSTDSDFRAKAKAALLFNAISLAFYFSQFVFYAGNWPAGTERYNFPGLLIRDFAVALLLACTAEACRHFTWDFRVSPHRFALCSLQVLLALGAVLSSIPRNLNQSAVMVARSNIFMERIRQASAMLKSQPSMMLRIEPHIVSDYEPVFSVAEFVRAQGVMNPIAISPEGPDIAPGNLKDPLQSKLASTLQRVSDEGSFNLQPLAQSKAGSTGCYAIAASGPPSPDCSAGIRIWPPDP